MIRVAATTTDKHTAWRVRDALARHPLLGGGVTHIEIEAGQEQITLMGWVLDEGLCQLARKIAQREAGRRSVLIRLSIHAPTESASRGPAHTPSPFVQSLRIKR